MFAPEHEILPDPRAFKPILAEREVGWARLWGDGWGCRSGLSGVQDMVVIQDNLVSPAQLHNARLCSGPTPISGLAGLFGCRNGAGSLEAGHCDALVNASRRGNRL